jgi:hypothetical protein
VPKWVGECLVLCLILCLLSPWVNSVPLSSLAAVLFVIAFRMVNYNHISNVLVYVPKSNVGVMLPPLLVVKRMAGSKHIDRVNQRKYLDYDFSQILGAIYRVSHGALASAQLFTGLGIQ